MCQGKGYRIKDRVIGGSEMEDFYIFYVQRLPEHHLSPHKAWCRHCRLELSTVLLCLAGGDVLDGGGKTRGLSIYGEVP